MKINNTLEKISRLTHRRTGYALRHIILIPSRDEEMKNYYHNHDLFIYGSLEWQFFIDLIEEACK